MTDNLVNRYTDGMGFIDADSVKMLRGIRITNDAATLNDFNESKTFYLNEGIWIIDTSFRLITGYSKKLLEGNEDSSLFFDILSKKYYESGIYFLSKDGAINISCKYVGKVTYYKVYQFSEAGFCNYLRNNINMYYKGNVQSYYSYLEICDLVYK